MNRPFIVENTFLIQSDDPSAASLKLKATNGAVDNGFHPIGLGLSLKPKEKVVIKRALNGKLTRLA